MILHVSYDSSLIRMILHDSYDFAPPDAFADAVDEAESLVISSIAAEQEGNIMESYQLCNEANGNILFLMIGAQVASML